MQFEPARLGPMVPLPGRNVEFVRGHGVNADADVATER